MKLLFALALFTLLPLPSPAAEEGAGVPTLILEVEGEGSTVRKKSRIEESARVGTRIFPGEIVSTGPRGTVKLLTADGSVVKLGFGSRLQLEESSVVDRAVTWTANLILGYARALVAPQPSKATRFRFRTPSASVGVRGTEFVLMHDEASEASYLYTLEGLVAFGRAGCESARDCLEVRAGETSVLRKGAGPSRPSSFDLKELLRGHAARKDDEAARLSLFKAGRSTELSPQASANDLKKLVADSSEELAAAQDKALGRSREERIAINQSIADGSFRSYMKASDDYLKANGESPGDFGGAEELVASSMTEKFRLGRLVLKAERQGLFQARKLKAPTYVLRKTVDYDKADLLRSTSGTLTSASTSYTSLLSTAPLLTTTKTLSATTSATKTATSTLSLTTLSTMTLSSTTLIRNVTLLAETTYEPVLTRYTGTLSTTTASTTLSRTTLSTATRSTTLTRTTSTTTAITRSTSTSTSGTCYTTKETCRLVPCDSYYQGKICKGGSKTVCETTKVAVTCQ